MSAPSFLLFSWSLKGERRFFSFFFFLELILLFFCFPSFFGHTRRANWPAQDHWKRLAALAGAYYQSASRASRGSNASNASSAASNGSDGSNVSTSSPSSSSSGLAARAPRAQTSTNATDSTNATAASLLDALSRGSDWWFARDFHEPDCLGYGGVQGRKCPCGTPGLWNSNWYSNVSGPLERGCPAED